MTRNGKIARLPCVLREQLNRRIADGERGKKLVEWLNKQPEVIVLIHRVFGGRPIREQNLSEWKKGGYREWQLQQDALTMVPLVAKEAGELKETVTGPLSGHMAVWLTAHLMAVVRRLAASELKDAAKWKLLHEACADLAALRRGDQNAEWMEIEIERLKVAAREVELKYSDVFEKYKKRIVIGMETLTRFINDGHPQAKAAMHALIDQVRAGQEFGPLGKVEGEENL